jgi:hypothetical protein
MQFAQDQRNDAKRACFELKGELSKLKQQQKQPLARPQHLSPQPLQLKHEQQKEQKSPQEVTKSSTPRQSPSFAATSAAIAAAEHEAVLTHLRSRLSAADALVQASGALAHRYARRCSHETGVEKQSAQKRRGIFAGAVHFGEKIARASGELRLCACVFRSSPTVADVWQVFPDKVKSLQVSDFSFLCIIFFTM